MASGIPCQVSVKEAADILGKTEQFIRIGLQQKSLPIGSAVRMKGGRWSYHISPKLLSEYAGIELAIARKAAEYR